MLPLPELYMKQVIPMLASVGAKTIQTVYEGGPGRQCEQLEPLTRATNMIIQGENKMGEAPKKEDFLPIARNMSLAENNPDVVITCTYDAACKEWIQALREVDWSPKAQVFSICVGLEAFTEAVGTDSEYLIGMSPWDRSLSIQDGISGWTPEEFVELFEEYSGRNAAYHAALGQATVSLMAQAIEFSNSTAYEDVANALQNQVFETVFGAVSFDENGQNKMDLIATQSDGNGTVNVVYPKDLAGADLVYPMPTWSERDCMKLSPCNMESAYSGECRSDGTCECANKNEISFGKGPTAACHTIPEEDMTYINPSLKIIGYVFVGIQCVVSIFFISWSIICRDKIVVRLSQPIFLVFIALGCLIMSLSIIPLAQEGAYRYEQDIQTREITSVPANGTKGLDAACMAFPWLLALGFSVAFSALFAKIVRIRKIMANAQAFRRKEVPIKDVIFIMVIAMAIEGVVLLSWQLVAPLKWNREVVATSDLGYPTQSVGLCASENPNLSLVFYICLFVVNFVVILIALVLCYLTRHFKSELNEAKWITASVISILQVLLLVVPISIIARENTSASFFVKSAAVFITSMAVTMFIFVPKFISVHFNENSENINVSMLFMRSSRTRSSAAQSNRQIHISNASLGRSSIDHGTSERDATLQKDKSSKDIKKSVEFCKAENSSSSVNSNLSLARSSFNDFIFELLRFKAVNGHCRVPLKNGGILGLWVDKIMKEYKNLGPINRSLTENNISKSHEDEDKASPEPVIDLVIGNKGIFFANARGRSIGSNVNSVPESVRLDLKEPYRFDRIKVLAAMGLEWELPNDNHDTRLDTGKTSSIKTEEIIFDTDREMHGEGEDATSPTSEVKEES